MAVKVDLKSLIANPTGTQVRDAFNAVGVDIDTYYQCGADNEPVQLYDAMTAYAKANPGKVDISKLSAKIEGSQLIDFFSEIAAAPAAAPAGNAPAPTT